MLSKWQSGMSNSVARKFIWTPVSVLFFAHSYENESLVPKHHHNRPPTKPSNGRSRSRRYDVPVNDLAIAVVFYERHLLLLNQMTVFFDCPVNELNFLYPKVKRLWITCEAGEDNVVCFITVKYFRVESCCCCCPVRVRSCTFKSGTNSVIFAKCVENVRNSPNSNFLENLKIVLLVPLLIVLYWATLVYLHHLNLIGVQKT